MFTYQSLLAYTFSTLTFVHQAIEAGEDALKVIRSAERVGRISTVGVIDGKSLYPIKVIDWYRLFDSHAPFPFLKNGI